MSSKRVVEIFRAGCSVCGDAVEIVKKMACSSCDIQVHDMNDFVVAARAKQIGIRTVPAVVVDGILLDCCAGRGPYEESLRAAGIGTPTN